MKRGKHQLLVGNNIDTLPSIEPGTVQTCINSPPYFRLRSYLPNDHPLKHLEVGSEETIEEYIRSLVSVYRLVREALHETGTMWVNIAGSYSESGMGGNPEESAYQKQATSPGSLITGRKAPPGIEPLNLCNVPHRLVEAMRADGWIHRDTIIWSKKSPMPSSVCGWRWQRCRVKVGKCDRASNEARSGDFVRQSAAVAARSQREAHDPSKNWLPCPGCEKCSANGGYVLRKGSWRCTTSFEYVFMFAKNRSYFCDGDAVQEEAVGNAPGNKKSHKGRDAFLNGDATMRTKAGLADTGARETRNPRSVWTLSSEGTKIKHYAAYPTELVKRILLAATSSAGCCPKCLMPYAPIVESDRKATRPGNDTKIGRASSNGDSPSHGQNGMIVGNRDPQRHCTTTRIMGYRPSCRCEAGEPVPQIVLDPFAGSGTTLQTAVWYGRDAIGCELNDEYAGFAEQRIAEMPRCMIREMKQRNRRVPILTADEGLFAGCK